MILTKAQIKNEIAAVLPASGSLPGSTSSYNGTILTNIVDSYLDASSPTTVFLGNAATPEQYGAKGDNTTDDTAAFQALAADIRAGNVNWVRMGAGKTYKVWTATPADQSVLINLSGTINGLRWDCNGAQFNIAYTGNAITYIFLFGEVNGTGATNVEINDLWGTAATGKHVSGDTTGVNWVLTANGGGTGWGARNLTVNRANVTGGLTGVAITRLQGTGDWSKNIFVSGIFTNIGYPVANESDGLNTTFDIITNNAGRSYIGYNVQGVCGRVNSTSGNSLNDIEIACYGFQGDISGNITGDININYINRFSSVYGSSLLSLSHQQGDPNHSNIATTIANVTFDVDVSFSGTQNTFLFDENSFTGNGSSQSPGDPGNTNRNITFRGNVEGNVSPTNLLRVLPSAQGFNGTSTGTYIFQDLQIPNSTKPISIGAGSVVAFRNVIAPNMNLPTLDGSLDGFAIQYESCAFANAGISTERVTGPLLFLDMSQVGNGAFQVDKGNSTYWKDGNSAVAGQLVSDTGNFYVRGQTSHGLKLGANATDFWTLATSGTLTGTSTLTATGLIASADPGGTASDITFTNANSTTIAAGTGTVKMSSANNANNAAWIKIYIGTTAYWIPAWTTNAP